MDTHQTTDTIKISQDEQITLIRLNRPQARNTLSEAVLKDMEKALTAIAECQQTKVVVLASSGPAFSSGHDLKEIMAHRALPDHGRGYFTTLVDRCASVMMQLVNLPQPVIAAVDGVASAAGCQLVASCDLAVASQSSRFCTPGVNIGLFCSTPMVALSRNISRKHTMEMLLLGEMFSAEDAYRFGLINRIVPEGQAEIEALNLAHIIASKSPAALKIGKKAFYDQLDLSQQEAYKHTSQVMVENMLAKDAEEGMSAFVEKRSPEWPLEKIPQPK